MIHCRDFSDKRLFPFIKILFVYNILYTHWYVDIILKDLYIKIKKKKKILKPSDPCILNFRNSPNFQSFQPLSSILIIFSLINLAINKFSVFFSISNRSFYSRPSDPLFSLQFFTNKILTSLLDLLKIWYYYNNSLIFFLAQIAPNLQLLNNILLYVARSHLSMYFQSYLYIIKNPPIVPNIENIWMGMTLKCGILFGGQRFQSNVFRNSVAMGGTY